MEEPMNGVIWFREDIDLVARVIAEKRRRARLPAAYEGYRLCEQQQLREGLKAVRASGRVG
jgi:hypothetical protein